MLRLRARFYDASLGRWHCVDPLLERRIENSPYSYVLNNPILRVDFLGLTDYSFDKKTGEVKQVGKENDQPDRIVRTDKDGNVKKKGEGFLGFMTSKSERGKAKVDIDGIAKGILRHGQNFKTDDQLISVGGEGQPTVEDVKSFTLSLSEYVGKEIAGLAYSSNSSKNVTDMVLGGYKNNTCEGGVPARPTELSKKYGNTYTNNNILQVFHTHPNGELGGIASSTPEITSDYKGLQSQKAAAPNAIFLILLRVPGQAKPKEHEYTDLYKSK